MQRQPSGSRFRNGSAYGAKTSSRRGTKGSMGAIADGPLEPNRGFLRIRARCM